MSDWVLAHDGWVSLAQLLLWFGLAAASIPSLVRGLREVFDRRALLILGLLAASATAISLVVFPALSRHEALGHAGSYAHIYWGIESPAWVIEEWEAYVTYSLLRWIYWGLGVITERTDLLVPLVLNALARGAGVFGAGLFAGLWARSGAVGIVAAVLVLVDPVHAFWGASIFNLAIPYALATLCLVQVLVAWRSGHTLLFAAAAASGALVVALRVEWGLLGPALAVVLVSLGADWGRSTAVLRPRFWAPALAVLTVLGATLVWGGGDLTSQGGFHDVRGYVETIVRQGGILAWYGGTPFVWIALVVGIVASARVHKPAAPLLLFLAFAAVHLALSSFNDYGYRNALAPALLLVPLVASSWTVIWPGERGKGPLPAVAALALGATIVGSAMSLSDWATRYYQTGDDFEVGCCSEPSERVSTVWLSQGGCYMITDDETLWEAGVAGSHFNLMEPAEAAAHWDEHHGCVAWLKDGFNARVDELSVQDRALKLHRWYRWERRGWARLPDGSAAELLQLVEAPAGATSPTAPWSAAN